MRTNWQDPAVAACWDSAVGLQGDVFQRLIIKPYLAAMLSTTAHLDGGETTERFANLIKAGATGDCADSIIAAISASCDEALGPVAIGRVLDLGAGEGFIGRWLAPRCQEVTSIDVSEHLLEKGKDKASSDDKLRFYHGDLDEPLIAEDFDAWLREKTGDHSIHANEFDLVLCLNVLDHLEDPRRALSALSTAMARDNKSPELLLSTLNPDFFLADQTPFPVLPIGQTPPTQTVSMGPANTHVEIVPRSWLTMEKIISDAGFDIVSCDPIHISQYPRAIQQQFIEAARLSTHPSAGPFVLWRLRPARRGEVIALANLADQLRESRAFTALHRTLVSRQLQDSPDLQLLSFGAREPIAYRSNLPQGLFIVERGYAELVDRGNQRQSIGVGEVIGELEVGDDPFVGRYLYPLRAGSAGCRLLRIGSSLVRELAHRTDQESLARVLFDTLRKRVSTYQYVYHRRAPASQLGKKDEPVPIADCEALARLLLFSATMEGGQLRQDLSPVPGRDGLSILVNLDLMRRAIADEQVQISTSTQSYAEAAALFHALGLTDSFIVPKMAANGAHQRVERAQAELTFEAIKLLLVDPLAEQVRDPTAFRAEVADAFAEYPKGSPNWPRATIDWQLPLQQNANLFLNQDDGRLQLKKDAALLATELHREICARHRELDPAMVDLRVRRLLLNLAFAQHQFLRRATRRFFIINDLYALRRIAIGTTGWLNEFTARAEASPYVSSRGVKFIEEPQGRDESDAWRFDAYLKRFLLYARTAWLIDRDLNHTQDAFYELPNLIGRALSEQI